MSGSPCAHIREVECRALMVLSPLAAKVFIAIRFGRNDSKAFDFGVRDLENWGVSKDQASRAIAELVTAGLIQIDREATFGTKRARRKIRIVHTGEKEKQSRQRDTAKADSRKGATIVPIQSQKRDCTPTLQSRQCDIPKEASRPSASKPEGREALSAKQEARRRGDLAATLKLPLMRLLNCAGGPGGATELALKMERGELSLPEIRQRLRLDGASEGDVSDPPMVFTISDRKSA